MSAIIPALYAEQPHPHHHDWIGDPDLWLYRDRTVALLRRYLYLAVETGRLPSLLGREFFRARVSCYHVTTFEDAVIFVHDVEHSLEQLDDFSQQLIARVVLQEYSEPETARLLHCSLRTVARRIPDALDQLTGIFLTGGLLKPFVSPPTYGPSPTVDQPCQYGETQQFPATNCTYTK